MDIRERIRGILHARKTAGEFRSLSAVRGHIDLTSNDYLGLSQSESIRAKVKESEVRHSIRSGSTGSRLLSGNSHRAEALESKLAAFHNAESALIMNSGYAANIGLIGTLCREGDLVLYDSNVHASIHQGMRLGYADSLPFDHNDIESLEKQLKKHAGKSIFVVVESAYSMDGDHAPLKEICALKKDCEFELIVDEAHALGVFGKQGRGLCDALGVADQCLARIYTFGKALGSHGAVVIGPQFLKDYLVNYCKPLIYSTALDDHTLLTVEHSYDSLLMIDNQRVALFELMKEFKRGFPTVSQCSLVGDGPVFGIVFGDTMLTRQVSGKLNEAGFDVRPIVYPTVARGAERIRISLHSFNTAEEIDLLFFELEKQVK
ncbi:MAG: pyridoxal phosphate-dependent aminotransferase family protein [Bacteroidetes bacterium]|nr:pyridoxal phosphate-dependent aminotransferase family protein [Bacteroidota bacterium]